MVIIVWTSIGQQHFADRRMHAGGELWREEKQLHFHSFSWRLIHEMIDGVCSPPLSMHRMHESGRQSCTFNSRQGDSRNKKSTKLHGGTRTGRVMMRTPALW